MPTGSAEHALAAEQELHLRTPSNIMSTFGKWPLRKSRARSPALVGLPDLSDLPLSSSSCSSSSMNEAVPLASPLAGGAPHAAGRSQLASKRMHRRPLKAKSDGSGSATSMRGVGQVDDAAGSSEVQELVTQACSKAMLSER